jgi:predicted nucleic acid-binding protein
MIFVDTSAWFASVVPTDVDHTAVNDWLDKNTQPLITTDMEKLHVSQALAFDHHFRQFGTVHVLP